MASNKLFVRLSGEAVWLLCPSGGHHYAAGPSVGAYFFRTIFTAVAPYPARRPRRFRIPRRAHPHLCGLASS